MHTSMESVSEKAAKNRKIAGPSYPISIWENAEINLTYQKNIIRFIVLIRAIEVNVFSMLKSLK